MRQYEVFIIIDYIFLFAGYQYMVALGFFFCVKKFRKLISSSFWCFESLCLLWNLMAQIECFGDVRHKLD